MSYVRTAVKELSRVWIKNIAECCMLTGFGTKNVCSQTIVTNFVYYLRNDEASITHHNYSAAGCNDNSQHGNHKQILLLGE